MASTNLSEETRKKKKGFGNGQKNVRRSNKKSSQTHYIPVNQYSLDGVFIKSFESIASAYKELCVKDGGHISHCCKGRYLRAYGYKWAYKADNRRKVTDESNSKDNYRVN